MPRNSARLTTRELQDQISQTERMIGDIELFVRHMQASGAAMGDPEEHQWEQLDKLRRERKKLKSALAELERV